MTGKQADNFAHTVCSNVLLNALSLLNSKTALLCLFNFLKDLVPFEHILCFRTDRNKLVMNIIMDYTSQASSAQKHAEIKVKNLFSWEKLSSLARANPMGANMFNSMSESQLGSYYVDLFPYPVGSAIYLLIDANRDENSVSIIYFINQNEQTFTKQHLQIVRSLQHAILEAAMRLIEENQDNFIELSTEGIVSSSSDALLRQCEGLAEVMSRIDAVSPTSGTVLITGQTGVGKELVAESIHTLSPRWRGPLVKVNCGAIPDTLIDSELFGHEKGAFTGASTARSGYFEQAIGGTIYLDEIGELPLQAQVRLLRVLETKEIRRIGGTRTIPLDIRVIAATNKDLWKMVEEETFREDLWYRLNVFRIHIPPLSERLRDIPILVKYFYMQYIKEEKIIDPPKLSNDFINELITQNWRGNVRELRYAVERAILIAMTDKTFVLQNDKNDSQKTFESVHENSFTTQEKDIKLALIQSKGRIQGKGGAAELLNISPSTLRNRMTKLGIPLPRSSSK